MRKVMKNLFVFTLVLAIIVSNSMTAFATENTGKNPEMVTCAELGCTEEVHLEGCEFYVEPKDTQEEVDEEDKEADGTEETTTPAPETDANNGVAAVSEDGEDVAYVAKIGETSYETFEAALTAASDMTGDVTVEIYDKVTLNSSLSGSYNSIKFAGKNSDAEIYLEVQGYITASGKKVAFEELILSKSAGGFIGNAGFMNVAFGVYDVSEVTYTDCTFENGAYASAGEVTFTGCTFKHSHDKYGLWAYGNVDVKVDGCTFADYRGIKMYAEGAAKTVDLTVENTDFTAVTDKPAIVLTYGESVTLANNTYSSTGTFELDLDGAPNGTAVTSDVAPTCKNDNGACGVLVDGKIYTTVAQAAEAATSGSTVTLLHESTETVEFTEGVTLDKNGFTADNVTVDNETPAEYVAEIGDDKYETLQAAIDAAQTTGGEVTITLLDNVTENVTIDEKVGHYLTIDGADKTVNGKITINPLSDTNDNRRITIQNIKFVNTADTGVDFITANQTNHYPRLSVLNCDFTGNGKDTDVAIRTKSAYDLIIKDCTGTGLHSFLQNTAGVKVTVRNVTVTDSKGGLAMGTAQNVEVRGCNLTTDTYGIRLDAVLDTSATLNGNVVNAYIPVSVRKATAAEYKLTLSGSASSYTATNTDGKWMAICGTEYEENVALNPATGNVKLTWNTDVLDESGVYGAYEWPIEVVYSDGYTRGFDSLASAMSHGYSGSDEKTIIVHEDITESMSSLEGNITTDNPNGVTIKNTIVGEWIYCGENFTIGKGVTYDATGASSGLFVYAEDAVINGTVLTDCYYQRYADTKLTINEPGSMTVKTETFILRYTDGDGEAGIYIVGDNNDETVGLDAAVIYFYQGCINAKDADIKVGTYWQTNTTDGTGSANLILDNSNMTVTVSEHNMKATGNSTVTLINGSNVNAAKGYEGVAAAVDETSTFTKGTEKKPVFVAKVGVMQYATLQDAIKAAEGETITVLSDVTLSDSDTIIISDKQVLDLNGKTLNGNIVVAESGDVTIKNGSIVNKDSEVSAIETVGTLTLEDVDITSARHAVRVEGGTTTINSGRYKVYGTAGMTTHALNAGGGSSEAKVIINGGVFVGPADTEADSGAAINVQNMATVEIKDGAFIGGKNQTLASAGTLTVYGGCFDQEVPAEYLAEGKACVKGTYTYEGDAYPYAVKAFPSAGDGSGSSDKDSDDKEESKEPVEVHYAKTAAQTTSAKTGDASNAMLWICIMGVALITVVTVFAIRKKSEK